MGSFGFAQDDMVTRMGSFDSLRSLRMTWLSAWDPRLRLRFAQDDMVVRMGSFDSTRFARSG